MEPPGWDPKNLGEEQGAFCKGHPGETGVGCWRRRAARDGREDGPDQGEEAEECVATA